MDRRKFVTGSAAVIGAASLPRTYAQAQAAPDKIRVGYAISISGPLGAGAENTTISQYKLWHKRVNDAGGIMLKKFNKKVPIEMVAYDDRGQPDELIKLTERLILQDKVDLLLSPYATHMNLAAAPIANKYEYPVIFTTAGSARIYQLAKDWPYAFWSIAQPNEATAPLVEMCADSQEGGQDQRPRRRGPRRPAVDGGNARGVRGRRQEGRARGRVQQELPVRRLGSAAADPGGDGKRSRSVHRLQLSGGHVPAGRAGANRRLQPASSLLGDRLGVPDLQGQVRKQRQRHSDLRRHGPVRARPR